MIRFDERTAECLVLVRKEGLMAAVGHDLRLRITRFKLEVDDGWTTIDGTFDMGSLRVVCALREGVEDPKALSEADRMRIEQTLRDEVLHVTAHSEARFRSNGVTRDGVSVQVNGELTMYGRSRPVTVRGTLQGDDWTVESRIHQPDWGIKPYSAMFGTLRVQADVLVKVSVPAVPPEGTVLRDGS